MTEIITIPESWKMQNILENSTLKARIGWQGLTTTEYKKTGKIYLVTGTDFKDGKIDWENFVYVDKKRYSQDKNIQIKIDDVLVTKDGTIGKIAYVDKLPLPTTLNSGIFVIRSIKNDYLHLFLFYILSSNYFIKFLNKLKAGSTIIHLYQKDFASFNFVVPPISEQQQIIQILSNTDKLIEKLEKIIEKKKNIKQGMLQELLTGKRRSKGFSGEWKNISFNDAFYITAGGDLDKISFSESQDDRHPFPIYSNSLINSGLYGFSSKFQYEKESITITARGTVGKANARSHKYSAIGRVLILKPIQKLDCFFVAEYINNKIKFSIESTGVPQLTTPQISKYLIDLPELDEQLVISNILSDMDSEIQELKQNRDKYIMIKQGMMQKLLTGEIRLV